MKIDAAMLRSMDLVTVEALLAPRSDYAGRSLEQVDFSRDYGFTAMGISRHGKTIHERPMSTRLGFGDSLLLLGYVAGVDRLARNPNLMILGQSPFLPVGKTKALITMALIAGVIGTAVSGLLSPAVSIPLVAMLVILFGCVKVEDAYKAVDWPAVVTVAGMIPFGVALEKTGAAAGLAHWIVGALAGINPTVVLGVILLLAVVLTTRRMRFGSCRPATHEERQSRAKSMKPRSTSVWTSWTRTLISFFDFNGFVAFYAISICGLHSTIPA